MADGSAVREFLQQRTDAYRTVTTAPGWRTVMLDLIAFAQQAPNDARGAGRYDAVTRIIKLAEGPLSLDPPEVKTNG
jgi:hypothetical protein